MKKSTIIAKHTFRQLLMNKALKTVMLLLGVLIVYAGITGLLHYQKNEAARAAYQNEVRERWVNSPDKHPHRMAHYGFLIFRPKSSLSFFDYGIENYTGNAVFLEAHRQNSTNFSEASLSNALLRFGEISIAMILQLLLPLFIFFGGFNTIAHDRENGTLKVLMAQGLGWKQLLIGKTIGVAAVAGCIFFPAALFTVVLYAWADAGDGSWLNLFIAFIFYSCSIFIYSAVAVVVSAASKTGKLALVRLIGIWLLFFIVLPRLVQAAANGLYPVPSKIAFESAVEADIIKEGDSHNPNDLHYKKLKDSVLKANNAATVQDLNFNYSGFQMQEGERISSAIYNRHLQQLHAIYRRQNTLLELTAYVNPYVAVKQLSMKFTETDFDTYTYFQQQAENYRYSLAQEMNALQIKLIPNKKLADTARPYNIDKKYWANFADFTYRKPAAGTAFKNSALLLPALLFWLGVSVLLLIVLPRKLNVI